MPAPCAVRIAGTATLAIAALFASGLGPLGPPTPAALADEPKKEPEKSVDADSVYYGSPKRFSRPAEVDVDAVYADIPEYKKIREKGLDEDDPQYAILMSKASKRFMRAVRKAARANRYDLVAALGAVKGVDDVPDITQDVIDRL